MLKPRQGKQIKHKISLGSPCTVWIHEFATVYESKIYPYESSCCSQGMSWEAGLLLHLAPSRFPIIGHQSTAGGLSFTTLHDKCHLLAFKVYQHFGLLNYAFR